MTHAELVVRGKAWLHSAFKCVAVLADFRTIYTSEQPDVIGWANFGLWSVLLECKASRADFRRDLKKTHRQADNGMGQERWYFAPKGVIPVDKLPEDWGLAEVSGSRVLRTHYPPGTYLRRPGKRRRRGVRDPYVTARELPLVVAALKGRPGVLETK